MNALSIPQALFTHAQLTAARGGKQGMRHAAGLKAALHRPTETFNGQPLYPDDFQQAAALLQALVEEEPFTEGSLSSAVAITMLSLARSGYTFQPDRDELMAFAERVRKGEVLLLEMAVWIKGRCKK